MGNQISHCYLIRYPDVTVSDTRILPYPTPGYYRIRHSYITVYGTRILPGRISLQITYASLELVAAVFVTLEEVEAGAARG